MGFEHKMASMFSMSPQVWERHANPWSVWTRYAAMPLLIATIWSRVWIGWWSLALVLVVAVWIWLNPRVFSRPETTDHWASKAVLGERVWLNPGQIPIPEHQSRAIRVLNVLTALGGVVLLFGLIKMEMTSTLLGACLVLMGKSWFLDRMVWLFDEMIDESPEYRRWLY